MDGSRLRDTVHVQEKIAGVAAAVQVLNAGLQAMADEVQSRADAGTVDDHVRGRMWSTMIWTHDQCRLLISELVAQATSSVYGEQNPIESALRDIHAISASMEPARANHLGAGRVILGL